MDTKMQNQAHLITEQRNFFVAVAGFQTAPKAKEGGYSIYQIVYLYLY